MAFSVGYFDACSNNIRHIYSTRFQQKIEKTHRNRLYNPLFLETDISLRRNRKLYNRRLFEYNQEYDTAIPRAPAFRSLPPEHVKSIVGRLTEPMKEKSDPRSCERYSKGFKDYQFESQQNEDKKKTTRAEMNNILVRLCRPTVASQAKFGLLTSESEDNLAPVSD
ncbi:hypothetical protein CHS0354_017119 [Potamilus streckersoni]|uniref:Uncharacterized protein n=1 Tax=Potamilus streckersoni TaxID=2493646 RepID=A0AAE0SC66_9BIVA|nr:hypothetical protein CHS0354_017119 [Potamilus streckersoni]